MAKIRVDLESTVIDGQALTFKSPADCSQITGLIVYYPEGNGTTSKDFKFVDAHGVDVGSGTISLFAANVLVKVLLDIDEGKAYVQNADTNAYLEEQFASLRKLIGEITPPNDLWSETVSDIAVAVRSGWQISGQVPYLADSNTEAAICVTTTNPYSYTDRDGNSVYMMPVPAKACHVTVTVADGTLCNYRFTGLKFVGSGFTTVFTASQQLVNDYSWMAGTIDYILISLERADGASWALGDDDKKITVTFTNGS